MKSEELQGNMISSNNTGMYDSKGYIMNMPTAGVAGISGQERSRSVTPPLRSVRREEGDRRFNTGYGLVEKFESKNYRMKTRGTIKLSVQGRQIAICFLGH